MTTHLNFATSILPWCCKYENDSKISPPPIVVILDGNSEISKGSRKKNSVMATKPYPPSS